MKKVCVVTAARSEYGLLRWVIDCVEKDSDLQLQLLVTGSHLSQDYGETYKEIISDGYHIDEKIPNLMSLLDKVGIVKSMGLCQYSIADAFDRLFPDIILVLGDRYELLPICSSALLMRIPIAHISGGEITNGAIDNEVRNAVSMMADLHFPGTFQAKEKLLSMGVSSDRIFVVGELGVENACRIPEMSKEEIAEKLGLDLTKKWILFTYHPETRIELQRNISFFNFILAELTSYTDIQIIASYSNADYGGSFLNAILEKKRIQYKERIILNKNLGEFLYVNLLRTAFAMVGNSSSGIFETQLPNLPVLNIGNRQDGRMKTLNIIDCPLDEQAIHMALQKMVKDNFDENMRSNTNISNIYGDGHASQYIVEHLKKYLFHHE